MSRDTRPRLVKRNHSSTMPTRYAFLDTEAHGAQDPFGQRQRFRLAVVAFVRQSRGARGWAPRRYETVRTPADLWDKVEAFTRDRSRVVVACHNLGYDLLVSEALTELPARGWRIDQARLDSSKAWAVWRRGTRSLVMVDTLSWLPKALAKIGDLVGVAKPPLPAWEDSDEAWEVRCQADVEILATAFMRLMDWIGANDCGQWRPTGAGMAWSAYRHKFPPEGIVHHGQAALYEAERHAAHAGRLEAWRHGRVLPGPVTEWDMTLAYPVIAREAEVPIAPRGQYSDVALADWHSLRRRYAVLSDVTVTTSAPTVPARREGRVLWPVGTFRTWLWENEAMMALDHGAELHVHRAVTYQRAPALRDWAEWVIGLLDDREGVEDPVVRLMVKFWARSVIGRFGAQWAKWEDLGPHPVWSVHAGIHGHGNGAAAQRFIHLGRQYLLEGEKGEAPDSCPSVMSWIMAECRVRLWRETEAAGAEHVAYLATDSLLVDRIGDARLRRLHSEGWRPKRSWSHVEVLGPGQLILGGEVKASGIPRGAVRTGARTWAGEAWSTPMGMLRRGEPGSVLIQPRQGELRGTDERRHHLEGGETAPILLGD